MGKSSAGRSCTGRGTISQHFRTSVWRWLRTETAVFLFTVFVTSYFELATLLSSKTLIQLNQRKGIIYFGAFFTYSVHRDSCQNDLMTCRTFPVGFFTKYTDIRTSLLLRFDGNSLLKQHHRQWISRILLTGLHPNYHPGVKLEYLASVMPFKEVYLELKPGSILQ